VNFTIYRTGSAYSSMLRKKNALLHTMSSMLVEVKFMEELIMADKVLFGPLEEVRSKLWRH
jgi:hypothetical protein